MTQIEIKPVGRVESPLTERAAAPKQGNEGAPEAWLVFEPELLEARPSPANCSRFFPRRIVFFRAFLPGLTRHFADPFLADSFRRFTCEVMC